MKCFKNLLLILSSIQYAWALICSRHPSHTYAPKSPVDENFAIFVHGNPQTYNLGTEYRITLEAFNGARFTGFMLALENDNGEMMYNDDLGRFEVIDEVETRYSSSCYNMIESTNTNPKTYIEMKWIAPTEPGKGCVLIRATVLESRDVWYMDDGGLSRRICEEIVDDVESNSLTQDLNPCCACDEASYDIYFEGLWSRNLHPKDFPAQGFITRFSDIIGASHTSDYRFWDYGQLASEGMQQFAEHGALHLLQMEFNRSYKEGKIRTIVRARGPAFPNLNGHSVSSARVDPQHHLLSLASKIDPSPDWIVGISGLELCLVNCTWLQEKTISLYPWDIGTDAGPSYMSPDQPQVPADVIRRIRHDYPSDPRSPFFEENGEPMKPLASLTIRRKRLYERACEEEESNNNDIPRECATHPFNAWSECSAKCGQGTQWRRRVYKQPELAKLFKCDTFVRNYLERTCVGNNCYAADNDMFPNNNMEEAFRESDCQLSRWSAWSSCSKSCGEGRMMRRRQYLNSENEEMCQSHRLRKLMQYKKCIGRSCLGEESIASEEQDELEDNADNNELENAANVVNNKRKYQGYLNRPNEEQDAENEGNLNRNWVENEKEEENKENENLWQTQDANRPWPEINLNNDNEEEQKENEENEENENVAQDNEDEVPQRRNKYENTFNRQRFNNHKNWRQKATNQISHEEQEKTEQPWYSNREENEAEQEASNEANKFENLGRTFNRNNWKKESEENERYEKTSNRQWQAYNGLNENVEQTENSDEEPSITYNKNKSFDCCFKPLTIASCADDKIIGNFWFYNYCNDECMLYAADKCDRNQNKFRSLEDCEAKCRNPMLQRRLRQKQKECF